MSVHSLFLSVVMSVRDRAGDIHELVAHWAATASALASDWEVVVIDNGSGDGTLERLETLMGPSGAPNLQVFALTKPVDNDTANWAGVEAALGDLVVVVDPDVKDAGLVGRMLDAAQTGKDVVFALNLERRRHGSLYGLCQSLFGRLSRATSGVNPMTDAPGYRLLSRRVVNFVLQHPAPWVAYRSLPATGGFPCATLTYRHRQPPRRRSLLEGVRQGLRLLVFTSTAPMRLVTGLALLGAGANLLYSLYVIAIALLKTDVAPGWVTLSLQQSGMFLLLSLVLMVLSEYVVQVAGGGQRPAYHVGREFNSARMTRLERLNISEDGEARQAACEPPAVARETVARVARAGSA